MLRTRVITAVLMLVVLLAVLLSRSYGVIVAAACVLFAAASWEALRLFKLPRAEIGAGLWALVFAYIAYRGHEFNAPLLLALCVGIWVVRLAPSLKFGLPVLGSIGNRVLTMTYGITIFGCFLSMLMLYRQSEIFLLSSLAVIWAADIGAYFSGKAFGRRKLAPSISPGKSWEGVIGGWLTVLLLSIIVTRIPALTDTFSARMLTRYGWIGFFLVLTAVVLASVVGDLFESQLKRRAEVKDSSHLLPGHGGVLDRIDALIPTLPLMALVSFWNFHG